MPDLDTLTPAQRDALEDLEHNLDLIGARPLPCEIEWALARAGEAFEHHWRNRH